MGELIEVDTTETMRREAAADRLRAIADQLSKQNRVEFSREGITYTAKVPDSIEMTVEIELGDEGNELEIEIKW
jgi:amphi-Trp domain-containing protein